MRINQIINKINSNYKKLLRDFISAFLGVLIALLLTNWKEERKENLFISKSIISIYNDNKQNIESIDKQIAHLEKQVDTLNTYLEDNDLTLIDLIKKNHGLQTKMLIQSGWKTLENSQLKTRIDYDFLSTLTFMSENIDNINSYKTNIANILYLIVESKNSNDKYRTLVLINDLINISRTFKSTSEKLDSLITLNYNELIIKIPE